MCRNKQCLRDVANVTFFCVICKETLENPFLDCPNNCNLKMDTNKFPEHPKVGDKKSYENL